MYTQNNNDTCIDMGDMKYITIPITGKIQVDKGKYARIYVNGRESRILSRYRGRKVIGIIIVLPVDESEEEEKH